MFFGAQAAHLVRRLARKNDRSKWTNTTAFLVGMRATIYPAMLAPPSTTAKIDLRGIFRRPGQNFAPRGNPGSLQGFSTSTSWSSDALHGLRTLATPSPTDHVVTHVERFGCQDDSEFVEPNRLTCQSTSFRKS